MFESGHFSEEQRKKNVLRAAQLETLTWLTLTVIVFSIFYFFAVLWSEIKGAKRVKKARAELELRVMATIAEKAEARKKKAGGGRNKLAAANAFRASVAAGGHGKHGKKGRTKKTVSYTHLPSPRDKRQTRMPSSA